MQTEQLISSLIKTTESLVSKAEKLRSKSDEELNFKANSESWSILECLEHLNLYGDFYLPEISKSIKKSATKPATHFRSGWLGNYFAQSMLPKEKLNRMKTFKDKNPAGSNLDRSVIDRFVTQQNELVHLLHEAAQVNLNKVRITTSISKLIRLKLGDTFRFIINHNIRHMKQIDNIKS